LYGNVLHGKELGHTANQPSTSVCLIDVTGRLKKHT